MEHARDKVLDLIQSGFPLASDPYGAMAEQLGTSRRDVMETVASLRADGSIRRLGASFASKKLGYSSTLCALAVPGGQERVDRAAAVVNSYPNVTHNYQRDNCYNLWFTIIARGPDEVARILAEIEEDTGVTGALNLPATALYKIRVDFGAMEEGTRDIPEPRAGEAAPPAAPFDSQDPFDVALVRWAQGDIAGRGARLDPEPFATAARLIAAQTGDASIDERRVIERLRAWKAQRVVRRFGALVAHRRIGYAFNGMTVWDIVPAHLDEVGAALASHAFVSHCYARPRSSAWPYNLYAMVHAKTRGELERRVQQLEQDAHARALVLVSSREYKKSSMRYFE